MKKLSALALALTAATVLTAAPADARDKTDAPVTIVTDSTGFSVAPLAGVKVDDTYRLSKYDIIQLHAIGIADSDINGTITSGSSTVIGTNIGPDGHASLPYIGNIKLAGLTIDEATALLERELGEYLNLRGFSVAVSSYAPRKIYVMGSVKSPGIKELSVDSLNAYAAISAGGGVTNKGRSKHIQVIRIRDGVMYYREVNIDAFVKKHDLTQNVALEDGDIVYVPESNKIIFSEDIAPYINIWGTYKSLTD